MRAFLVATRWSAIAFLRTKFVWIWNIIMMILIMLLRHLTHFGFNREEQIVHELFLSTLGVASAVTSMSFQLEITLRQKARGEWVLVRSSPAGAAGVVGGLCCGLVLVQVLWGALLVGSHVGAAALLGRQVPEGMWQSLGVVVARVLAVSFFHTGVSVVFEDTWALIVMVGGYMAGQLSAFLYDEVGDYRVVADLLYCVIPDLQPLGQLGGEVAVSGGAGAWIVVQTALYGGLVVVIGSAAFVRKATARRS